jgi:drug/metabolite transporter (DMT)-like permease
MGRVRLAAYTMLTMSAFAANSLLCRLALKTTTIDPASFTAVRIFSGALMLGLVAGWRFASSGTHSSWRGGFALFVYVAAFSFSYLTLSAGTGALLLFGSVQITMLLAGWIAGERMGKLQSIGFIAALIGVVILMLPGVEAPALSGSALMIVSGIAWGAYSLLGRGIANPTLATTGNFMRAVPFAMVLALFSIPWIKLDTSGLLYALLSGALTSGLGYVLWYRVLQAMRAITAATVQLSVPMLAALGGTIWLGEAVTAHLLIASLLILGGIGLVLRFSRA